MSAINMNKAQFEQSMHEEKPVLVDYWAPWCVYCRRIAPAYEKIAEEYGDQLVIGKVIFDEEWRVAAAEMSPQVATSSRTLWKERDRVSDVTLGGYFIQDAIER